MHFDDYYENNLFQEFGQNFESVTVEKPVDKRELLLNTNF
jgi:hypothetical protein